MDVGLIISGSIPIRIFDTATWQQIAILEGHTGNVNAISLSQNNRLLSSISFDQTARLWNLDTNLPVGPLQHEGNLGSAALSPDGKVLVTGCQNKNAYIWDVHAILKEYGLEGLLLPIPNVPTRKPLMNSNATPRPPTQARRIPQDFFDGVQHGTQSSAARGTHSHSPAQHLRSTFASLLDRLSSLFRQSHSDTDGVLELQQRSRWSIFSHRGPRIVEAPTVQDRKALFVARQPERDKAKRAQQQQTQSHSQAKISSSHIQSNPSTSGTPPAPATTTPRARPAHSRLVRLLSQLVLFLCCASPQGGNSHPTQQQSQSQAQPHATSLQTQHQQGQSQAQASSSQTQPTAPSTSATPAVNAHTTAPGAASGQPRPLPLRTRFVLFICCASLPHADGH
ncbi:hypothetical protein BDR03DRAFT_967968 [Suillus americanus]|nr:hypothetical protein BDR03DRAFT_967968 [Suillus americanus]